MVEKWFGEKCKHQICRYETDCFGEQDKSYPVLIYCNHSDNKMDCEGNCNKTLCPKLERLQDGLLEGLLGGLQSAT